MPPKPYAWTEAIEDEIFGRIAKGEALHLICDDEWLPSPPTFYKRLNDDAAFAEKYARAKDMNADRVFDEIEMISDMATPEDVQVARLRIDTRKWRLSKLKPKVYGDKLDLNHTGAITVTLPPDSRDL
jgi:hypothetical protein